MSDVHQEQPTDKDALNAWLREQLDEQKQLLAAAEGDNTLLRQRLDQSEERNVHVTQRLEQSEQRARLLEEKVDYLLRQLYGSKSEKLDSAQLELLLKGEEAKKPSAAEEGQPSAVEAAAPVKKNAPRKREGRMRRSMESLPRREEVIIPLEVQQNPEEFEAISEEVSERLEVTPPLYWVDRKVRKVYRRKGAEDGVEPKLVCAPLPAPLLEGSVLSASLAADILDKKYCQHLPFYRQEQQLKLVHGLEIRRDMLCHWHGVAAEWMEPLYRLIAGEVRANGYVQADETPVDYQMPGAGKTARGYFWVYRNPVNGAVVYDWHEGRGHQCLQRLLGGYHGILQTDGYRAYETWVRSGDGEVVMMSCLAHIRRKFEAALDDQPRLAGWILRQIGIWYEMERKLRDSRAGPRLRLAQRQAQAGPIYHRLHRVMMRLRERHAVRPTSPLGRALDYALAEWDGLKPCLEDGRLEPDNNGVENAIRPLKLGEKNWLFIGRESTGWRTAVVLTIVENVRRLGLSPREYLQWVLERLPRMTNQDDLRTVLPTAWAATKGKVHSRVA